MREELADDRERRLDDRERRLDERSRTLGREVASAEQRTREAIERSQVLLAAREARRNRSDAALRRAEERHAREREAVERAAAERERERAAEPPDPAQVIERSRWLRKKIAASLEAFAVTEEEVARVHEELAARRGDGGEKHRRIALEARQQMRRARDLAREYGGPPDPEKH